MSEQLETRTFEIEFREDSDEGTFEGIAVPWNQTVNIGGKFFERFERGSIDPSERVSVYRDHKALIGHLVQSEDREEGLWVKAKVALSDLGKDTLALLRSGALSKLSVGFVPVEQRQDGDTVVRSRVSLREVSVVERPAYSLANILAVREDQPVLPGPDLSKETNMSDQDNAVSAADLDEVRSAVEEVERRVASFDFSALIKTEPEVDTRSAGEVLKAIVSGDDNSIRDYEGLQARAYTGGTSADSPIKASWTGDLTRIFDNSSGVLSAIFAKDTLPEKGMSVEYAELLTNTVTVTEQVAEGDDLPFGKVTLTTKTAPVKTYGGYTQLTRQEIERSTLPILNRSLEAMAVAAGARAKAVLRAQFDTTFAAQLAAAGSNIVTLGATLGASTITNWEIAVVRGAVRFDNINYSIDDLVVSQSVFEKFVGLLDTAGRPLFAIDGDGSNNVGTLRLPGLSGSLAGIRVVMDAGLSGDKAAFVNGAAIRQYQSNVVALSDENIVNLSKTFSVYRYGAVAPEIPQAIVPVKLTA